MNLEAYSLAAEDDFTLFRFVSKGRRPIDKIVQFQKLEEGFYNLAFGDRSLITGGLDDLIVSNNGDSEKWGGLVEQERIR